ncbi:MAG: hypothetical protein AAF702_05000 [Chloroflexota bacterium]
MKDLTLREATMLMIQYLLDNKDEILALADKSKREKAEQDTDGETNTNPRKQLHLDSKGLGQEETKIRKIGGRYSLNCGHLPFNSFAYHFLQFNPNLLVARPLHIHQRRDQIRDMFVSKEFNSFANVFEV